MYDLSSDKFIGLQIICNHETDDDVNSSILSLIMMVCMIDESLSNDIDKVSDIIDDSMDYTVKYNGWRYKCDLNDQAYKIILTAYN